MKRARRNFATPCPRPLIVAVAVACGALSACVDPGSKNLDPQLYTLSVHPGKTTVWAAPDDGPLAGLELTFGPRAVDADAQLQVYGLEATTSPVERLTASGSALRYRLIAPAFGLRPQGVIFYEEDVHARVAAPRTTTGHKSWRLLSAPSIEALGEGLWQSEMTVTAETSSRIFIGVLPQTQEYWPTELTAYTSPKDFSADPGIVEYQACLVARGNPAYPGLEQPEAADECAADADCVRSGCGMEVCSTGNVSSACRASDPPCGGCVCFSGTCRWVQ